MGKQLACLCSKLLMTTSTFTNFIELLLPDVFSAVTTKGQAHFLKSVQKFKQI